MLMVRMMIELGMLCSGIFHDHDGEVRGGFIYNIGRTISSFSAETWDAVWGLSYSRELV